MGKRVIRLGDPTTHGGTVVSATTNYIMFGKEVAGRGDKATCPRPGHGVVTIVEGDPLWTVNGKNVALEGHKCSCGCSLISTLPKVLRSYESSGASNVSSSVAAVAVNSPTRGKPTERFDEHFVLKDQVTGDVVGGFVYGIETRAGEHHDHLYEDGATIKAYSQSPIPVQLIYAMQEEIGLR